MGNFIEDIIDDDLESGRVTEIVTRFPPEPNGYLHIGHAKAICLNVKTAKKYNGKCNLRMDDTNPLKEDHEYVNSIIEDAKWLGWSGDVFYASDYFEVMYECAVKLIKKGLAYVDDITSEQMREMRGTLTTAGIESKNRNRPNQESLSLFEDMKNGLIADGALVLRAKIDMASPNINMRDPIIYRVLRAEHFRHGNKWCIYPMYDFAHPIEDAVEKISHSICTLEFEDHRPFYDWVVTNCEFDPPPHQYEFAKLVIERTIMGKRYLKKLVDEGFVDGWDDPRMPTVAALRRRGYTPSSIREFCDRIGVAKSDNVVQVAQLESCIRDELNMTAKRAMAVLNPVKLVLQNRDDSYSEELDFEYTLGEQSFMRKITISNTLYIEREDFEVNPPPKFFRLKPDGMVRLKSGYIIKYASHTLGSDGQVDCIYADIIEGSKSGGDNSGIKVKGVIHWVNAKDCASAEVRLYDYLLTDDESESDYSKRLNRDSLIVKKAMVENMLQNCSKAESFQFLRQGYFTRDTKSEGLVFNRIVGLKDSFKK